MKSRALGMAAASVLSLFMSPACMVVQPDREIVVDRDGRPYRDARRARRDDLDLAFDDRLGVYAVVGWSDHFFWANRFYRRGPRYWEIARAFRGPWGVVELDDLPGRLSDLRVRRDRDRDADDDRDRRRRRDRDYDRDDRDRDYDRDRRERY